ncbi:MAG: hypothetical protein QF735_11955 [Phycisphaeraceae bacterium]|nr:hypothetical protein [Phycisphaeraceae bacterium]
MNFEEQMSRGGAQALEQAGRFFMRDDPVHDTLRRITGKLDELSIAYAVVDGMALVAHGYDRTTMDVDILITPDGLAAAHEALAGRGYVQPFEGSRQLRDTQSNVRIEFLITGEYPGDGKPKPVAFPDPDGAADEIDGIRYVRLVNLIELKLSSGMTNSGRLRDLADVQELVRARQLTEDVASRLDPYVRDKYLELWRAVQADAGER